MRDIKYILLCYFLVLVLFYFFIGRFYIAYNSNWSRFNKLSDLRFETMEYEEHRSITVEKLLTAEGDMTYIVKTSEGETIVSEDIYNEYLSGDITSITIRKASASIYIKLPQWVRVLTIFPKAVRTIHCERYSYPWENPVSPYTEEELKVLAQNYLNGEMEANGFTLALPDDANTFADK